MFSVTLKPVSGEPEPLTSRSEASKPLRLITALCFNCKPTSTRTISFVTGGGK